MSTLLIRHGTLLTDEGRSAADICVEHGVVTRVGAGLDVDADTIIDASGLLVMPGGIDAHTHLDMPAGDITTTDDFESGTMAAACGGTTTLIDFATPEPGQRLHEALETWMAKADGKAVIDYGFHMVLREFSARTSAEVRALAAIEGVTSFKMFMAYPGRLMAGDGEIAAAMDGARAHGGLVMLHAEDGPAIEALVAGALARGDTAPRHHARTRPPRTEADAVARGIALAERSGAAVYIVHLSSAEGLEAVRAGRARGARVFAETCPQYLCLSDAEYERPGFEAAMFVMSPPLRPAPDGAALWRGLASGLVDTVGTDHCPFGLDHPPHKQRGRGDFSKIPNGAPGIETRLMLLWDDGVRAGRLTPERFVDVTSAAPAKVFGLWPRKGTIAEGADADIVVWDPARRLTLSAATQHMRVDHCLYEGRAITGAPATVIARGEIIVANGAFVGRRGRGRFLRRGPSGAWDR
jgi:dihydropyrimidinase